MSSLRKLGEQGGCGEGIHSHVLGVGVVNLLTIPGEPLVRTACLMEHSAVGCHCVAL